MRLAGRVGEAHRVVGDPLRVVGYVEPVELVGDDRGATVPGHRAEVEPAVRWRFGVEGEVQRVVGWFEERVRLLPFRHRRRLRGRLCVVGATGFGNRGGLLLGEFPVEAFDDA